MMLLNRISLLGLPTSDPQIAHVENEQQVINFSVHVNHLFTRDEGSLKGLNSFNIIARSKVGNDCKYFIKKNYPVLIEGRMQTRNQTNEDGSKSEVNEILAQSVLFLNRERNVDSNNDCIDDV